MLLAGAVEWWEEGIGILRNEITGGGKDAGDWSNFPETGAHLSIILEKVATEGLNSCVLG